MRSASPWTVLLAACTWATCAGMASSAARAHATDSDHAALASLVDAEMAFARMGSERGVRAAFLANFADDGIVFEPEPVRLRETWSARPAPADPLALKLEWMPAQAGIARSRDMGFTVGPSRLWRAAEPDKVRYGVFFSVWQRQGTGEWRVVLDLGITTPAAVDFALLGAAPRPTFRGRSNAALERRKLLAREADAFTAGAAGITPNGYTRLVAADVRLHRDGMVPIATRQRVAPEVARTMSRVTWKPIDARVAASGDMAVTYGRFREIDRERREHDGYYAHLWLRDVAGTWRLAYDMALAAPPR